MQTVLIVEDNDWQAQSIERDLQRGGFSTEVSGSALEAIDDIDRLQPVALVLDINLPVVNGLVLLHELQSHVDLAKIPVILMSNMSSDLPASVVADYGLASLIDKAKVQPGDVTAAVKKALHGRQD